MQGIGNGVYHFLLAPDTNLHDVLGGVRDQVDFDVLVEGRVGHLDLVVEQGNPSVAV